MSIVAGSLMENFNSDFVVFNLPYVFDSKDHQMSVLNNPEIVGDLYKSTEDKGMTVLGAFHSGIRNVYNKTKPIETPQDLAGMKIRIIESDTNIVANMLFGSISGSAVAAAAAVGGTMTPLQEKEGYKREFSAAVNIASAPTGMLIPPSNTLIVYSLVSGGTSIAALFMGGYIPGILWGIGCMIVAYFTAKRIGYKSEGGVTIQQALRVFWDAIPSLLLIVIVIGGMIGGVFTATEGSAIAVVYSLLLSFLYRSSPTFRI